MKGLSALIASVAAGSLVAAQGAAPDSKNKCSSPALRDCFLSVFQGYSICGAEDFNCQCTYARDVAAKCYEGCPENGDVAYVKSNIEDQCKLAQTVDFAAVRFKGDSDMQHRDDHLSYPFPAADSGEWGGNLDEDLEEDNAVPLAPASPSDQSDCGDDEEDYEEDDSDYSTSTWYSKPTPRPVKTSAPKYYTTVTRKKSGPAPTYYDDNDDSWDDEDDPQDDDEEDDEGGITKKMFKKLWHMIKGQQVDVELTAEDFKRSLDESIARAQLSPEQVQDALMAASIGDDVLEKLNFDLFRKKKNFLMGGWKEFIPHKGKSSPTESTTVAEPVYPTEAPPAPSSDEEEEDDCTPSTALDPVEEPSAPAPSDEEEEEDDCTPSTALDPVDEETEPVYDTPSAIPAPEPSSAEEDTEESSDIVPAPSSSFVASPIPEEPSTELYESYSEVETIVETVVPTPKYSTETVVEETTVIATETVIETEEPSSYSYKKTKSYVPEPESSWIEEPEDVETIVETVVPTPKYSTKTVVEETTVIATETEVETFYPPEEPEEPSSSYSYKSKSYAPEPSWIEEPEEESSSYTYKTKSYAPEPEPESSWIEELEEESSSYTYKTKSYAPEPESESSWIEEPEEEPSSSYSYTPEPESSWIEEPEEESSSSYSYKKTKSYAPVPESSWIEEPEDVETIVETVVPTPKYSTKTVVEETTVIATETEVETFYPPEEPEEEPSSSYSYKKTKSYAPEPESSWIEEPEESLSYSYKKTKSYTPVPEPSSEESEVETIIETVVPTPKYSTKTVVEETTVIATETEIETEEPSSYTKKTKSYTPVPEPESSDKESEVETIVETVIPTPKYSTETFVEETEELPVESSYSESAPEGSYSTYNPDVDPVPSFSYGDGSSSDYLPSEDSSKSVETDWEEEATTTTSTAEEESSSVVTEYPLPSDWYGDGSDEDAGKKSLKQKFTEKLKKVLEKVKGLKGKKSGGANKLDAEGMSATDSNDDGILARDVGGEEIIAGMSVDKGKQPPVEKFVSGANKMATSWVPLLAVVACLAYYDLNPIFYFGLAGIGIVYVQVYLPELVGA